MQVNHKILQMTTQCENPLQGVFFSNNAIE